MLKQYLTLKMMATLILGSFVLAGCAGSGDNMASTCNPAGPALGLIGCAKTAGAGSAPSTSGESQSHATSTAPKD